MKKGLLGLIICTIAMVLLFTPDKAYAGHDIGVLSKSNPYLEVEISMTKDDEHICFFQIDEKVETIGLYVKNLSGGGSTIEYDLLDNDWNVIRDYKFDADTIAVEGDVTIPASEYYFIDFKNPSFTGMNEMKLGICVYCPEFGGKASDYSRYNDLNQEYNEKQETVTAVEAKLSLSKTEVTLKKGKSVTLKATLSKKLKKKGVSWKSSDTKVAKVSKKGKVTAKGYGTAVITCTSKKDKKVKATCTVTVAKKTSTGSNTDNNPVVTSGDISTVTVKVGHGNNNMSASFRYVSGFLVGADGYFTLDSKDYSGELTLDFKTSEGVDSQKITVEKNTKYYLSYFYPIDALQDTVIQNPPQTIMTGTDPITGLPRYTTIPGTETRIPAVASTIATDVTVRGGATCTSSMTVAGTVKKGSLTYEKV